MPQGDGRPKASTDVVDGRENVIDHPGEGTFGVHEHRATPRPLTPGVLGRWPSGAERARLAKLSTTWNGARMSGAEQPRWVWPAAAVWVVGVVVIGEVRDPPVDWVRIGVRMVLGALTAWVVVNLILSASRPSRGQEQDKPASSPGEPSPPNC